MSKISTRIKNYSKTAAVILTSSSLANANVIYTDVVPDSTLSNGDSFAIDLNGSMVDFNLVKSVGGIFERVGLIGVGSANSIAVSSSSYYALALVNSASISNAAFSYWDDGAVDGVGYFYSYTSTYTSSSSTFTFTYSGSRGNWNGQANRFVGLRFDIGGNQHFGWVRLSVGNDYSSVTIHDFAYESVAGASIMTGDMGSPTTSVTNTIDLSDCDMVTVFGNSYTTSQVVNDTVVGGSSAGLDSITIANITIFPPATSSSSLEECDDATINGNTYTSSQTVIDTLAGASVNGCDSIHTTNLVINMSETVSIDTSIVQGGSITIDGNTVTTAGSYSETLQNAAGCDSTINYTVSVIQGIDKRIIEDINIYPNPAKDKITIDASAISSNVSQIKIVDLQGKELIVKRNISGENNELDISALDKGLYFLLIELNTGEYQITRITKM